MSERQFQSIYELAKQTGVSPSTVSRVLNQRGRIAAKTRTKVLTAARAAGFRPRMTARPVTIAVVVDRHRFATFGGFVSCLITSLVHALSSCNVAVELFTEQNLNRFQDRLIDGVLAMAWDDATVEMLRKLDDIPVVSLNRMDVAEFSAVATNHQRDGELAVEYFYGRGHRRIGFVSEERSNWGCMERVTGFIEKQKALGLEVDDQLIGYTEHQPMYGILRRMMALKPTALFMAGESMGLEALYILHEMLHVRVPEDISIIGMESTQVSQFMIPPLTTLAQPLDELAEKALSTLLEQVGASDRKPVKILLENRLIERDSVATVHG